MDITVTAVPERHEHRHGIDDGSETAAALRRAIAGEGPETARAVLARLLDLAYPEGLHASVTGEDGGLLWRGWLEDGREGDPAPGWERETAGELAEKFWQNADRLGKVAGSARTPAERAVAAEAEAYRKCARQLREAFGIEP